MEAYQAYHNSKENALLLSQTQSEELVNKEQNMNANNKKVPATTAETEKTKGALAQPGKNNQIQKQGATQKEGGGEKKDGVNPAMTTTNNYTTVMQSGANINITNINNHHTYVIYR